MSLWEGSISERWGQWFCCCCLVWPPSLSIRRSSPAKQSRDTRMTNNRCKSCFTYKLKAHRQTLFCRKLTTSFSWSLKWSSKEMFLFTASCKANEIHAPRKMSLCCTCHVFGGGSQGATVVLQKLSRRVRDIELPFVTSHWVRFFASSRNNNWSLIFLGGSVADERRILLITSWMYHVSYSFVKHDQVRRRELE